MTTPDGVEVDDVSHCVPSRRASLLLGLGLLLLSWWLAHHPITGYWNVLEQNSITVNLVLAGALPWTLQWGGVVCLILAAKRWARNSVLFALGTSFMLAATWWTGLLFRFNGMSLLETLTEVAMTETSSDLGTASWYDEMLFHVIGPMLNPLQLRGPVNLRGWSYLFTAVSTMCVFGYLMLAGNYSRVGGPDSNMQPLRVILAMLPLFIPPMICLIRDV